MKNIFKVNIIEKFSPFNDDSGAMGIAQTLTKDHDLKGRVFAITGTTLGSLGYETAKALLAQNAEVILLNRSADKMEATVEELIKHQPKERKGRLHPIVCDLSMQQSVHQAVKKIKAILTKLELPLDCLICSAGRYFKEKHLSEDGFEMTMATDHYGHFALTLQLLSQIKDNGRVVILSSLNHTKVSNFPMDDLKFENESYNWQESHNRAKLANMMFAFQLNNELKAAGSNILAYGVYPGAAKTNFAIEEGFILRNILKLLYWKYGSTPDVAAGTTIFSALDLRLEGRRNLYLAQCGISDDTNPLLQDSNLLKEFFEHSLRLTNLKFPNL